MLLAVPAIMIGIGLPAFIAMIGVAVVFAAIGVLGGTIPLIWLSAMRARLVGLLESDLLQALPLFVLMGGLLNLLPLADIVFRALQRCGGRHPAAAAMAGLGLGALMAPMNGSVGASAMTLARVVVPRLVASGVASPERLAALAVASTLGVMVPPSLVLILFGDAMMRAHSEALNTTRALIRVINTQDVFHGALLPAALLFVLYFLLVWRGQRDGRAAPSVQVSVLEWGIAAPLSWL